MKYRNKYLWFWIDLQFCLVFFPHNYSQDDMFWHINYCVRIDFKFCFLYTCGKWQRFNDKLIDVNPPNSWNLHTHQPGLLSIGRFIYNMTPSILMTNNKDCILIPSARVLRAFTGIADEMAITDRCQVRNWTREPKVHTVVGVLPFDCNLAMYSKNQQFQMKYGC